jgi:hypothetical protein
MAVVIDLVIVIYISMSLYLMMWTHMRYTDVHKSDIFECWLWPYYVLKTLVKLGAIWK